MIAGAESDRANWSEGQVIAALKARLTDGESLSGAAREVAKLAGWKKSAVYQLGISDG